MTPVEYCQQKAAQSGSSFYYSFLFLPPAKKRALMAVYAFCREIDDVVDECSDKNVATHKLNFWREEIVRTFAGTPTHPIGQALQTAVIDYALPQQLFLEMIEGMTMDLADTAYETFDELARYCYHVASTVGLLTIRILGYQDKKTEIYAIQLGIALQLINIIRDLKEDIGRGRIYLPTQEMQQFGVDPTLLQQQKITPALRDLLTFQAKRARNYFNEALAVLPEVDRLNQTIGLIMANIYFTLLTEIERASFPILTQRVSLTPLRKLWIAWRTLRQEKKRHRQWV